jgi:hypothetical protein
VRLFSHWVLRCGLALAPLLARAQAAPPPGKLPVIILPLDEVIGKTPVLIGYKDRWDNYLDQPDSAAYYTIYHHYPADSAGYYLRIRQYAVPGNRLVYDGSFQRDDFTGPVQKWHLNGKPDEKVVYSTSKRGFMPEGSGEMYYPSGQVRFQGSFRHGQIKKGTCFNNYGEPAPCPPYFVRAYLPMVGGGDQIQRLLQLAYLKQAPKAAGVTVAHDKMLQICFRVDSLGNVRDPRVFPSTTPEPLKKLAVSLMKGLGKFEPAQHWGVPANDLFVGFLLYRLPDTE